MSKKSFKSWDATKISYEIHGKKDAERTILLINGLTTTESYWRYLIKALSPSMRIVTFDLRGHGQSDSPSIPWNVRIEHLAKDAIALLDLLELDKVVAAGFSMGVQVLFELYRQAPERILALIPVLGTYQDPLGRLFDLNVPPKVWRATIGNYIRFFPRTTSAVWHNIVKLPIRHSFAKHIVKATAASKEDMEPFYQHQTFIQVPTVIRMGLLAAEHSARDVFPKVTVPTLIFGGGKDNFTPLELSEHMRDEIPGAEYIYLDDATHTGLLEHPEIIEYHITTFLARAFA